VKTFEKVQKAVEESVKKVFFSKDNLALPESIPPGNRVEVCLSEDAS
jgi:hypothetical protein